MKLSLTEIISSFCVLSLCSIVGYWYLLKQDNSTDASRIDPNNATELVDVNKHINTSNKLIKKPSTKEAGSSKKPTNVVSGDRVDRQSRLIVEAEEYVKFHSYAPSPEEIEEEVIDSLVESHATGEEIDDYLETILPEDADEPEEVMIEDTISDERETLSTEEVLEELADSSFESGMPAEEIDEILESMAPDPFEAELDKLVEESENPDALNQIIDLFKSVGMSLEEIETGIREVMNY